MTELGRRTVLGWLAAGGGAASLGAGTLPRPFPGDRHFLKATEWLQRIPLSGFGEAASRAARAVAASPLAVPWEEISKTPGFVPDDRDEEWVRPALAVFAVDSTGWYALPEAVDRARAAAAAGARAAVFTASDRGLSWPGPAAPRLARICVPCQAGGDEAALAAAMLALIGPARGVGCIGIDMADLDDVVFPGGDGLALGATVAPGLAGDAGGLIAEQAQALGIGLGRTSRALISAVMTEDCTLRHLDAAIGSVRDVIGDVAGREDISVACSAQFLTHAHSRLAATLLAFVDL
ncbi:hypothetical protein JL100_015275 [Skermanella mucosa]|uniref:hypothetical protein n=1 Tax=Skermanella mucosa TaxID=1789672 RepID=UPI00192C3B7E|nr:hypothetical protein [Skermanella mucosa]UEM18481.1 hypothetical protein JL100_015275 [Skermanella mucosa]